LEEAEYSWREGKKMMKGGRGKKRRKELNTRVQIIYEIIY